MFCRNCGQQNDDRAMFCVNCGKPLKKEVKKEQGNTQQTAPKKTQKTLWMLIVGIVILFVVICVLCFVLIFAKKDEVSADQSDWQSSETQDSEDRPEEETEEVEEESAEVSEEESTGEATEETIRDGKKQEEPVAEEVSYATIEECAAICRNMSKLDASRNADEDLLSSMAFTALQMEYAKGGNGDPQKLYTKLRDDDDSVLLGDLFNHFALRNDIDGIEGYHMWKPTDSARLLKESAAKRFVKDFYGNDDLDLSKVSCFEDQGDGYWKSTAGDGDPWYMFENYSIKENDDFYLLEGACSYGDNGGGRYFVGYAKYLFKKNTDSRLGVTLVYSEFDHQEDVNLAVSAEASSELASQGKKTYDASHLVDGNRNTCWVEGVSGTGAGETIELNLGKEQIVYGLIICNGYLESKYLYGINGKVSAVTVRTADGTAKQADLVILEFDEVKEPFETYEREGTENWINFDHPVYTDKIMITIDDAVAGSKYEDTCISEIIVY